MTKAEKQENLERLQSALAEMKRKGLPLRSLADLCGRAGVCRRRLNYADSAFFRDIREEAIAYKEKTAKPVNTGKISEAIDVLLLPGPMPRKISFALVRRIAGITAGISIKDYPEFEERLGPLLKPKLAPEYDDDRSNFTVVPSVRKKITWEEYAGGRPLCG